jgi:hypothetical protein
MIWARMLAYITGSVDHALLLRNEYLAAENRIPYGQKTHPRFIPCRRINEMEA